MYEPIKLKKDWANPVDLPNADLPPNLKHLYGAVSGVKVFKIIYQSVFECFFPHFESSAYLFEKIGDFSYFCIFPEILIAFDNLYLI